MFTLYKTVHPPTGIDCSIYCSFLSSKEQNLITASGNKLQVYRFNFDPNSKTNKLKLECFDTFYFYGSISCIKSCRYGSMQKDALVIAFSDAKVSIVEYDTFLGDIVTLSIHYFENELEAEGLQYNIYKPILKIDPNMRCAVMLIYGYKLAVIPFHEDHARSATFSAGENVDLKSEHQAAGYFKSESEQSLKHQQQQQSVKVENSKSSSASQSSYTIDLRKLDQWLEMRIIDIEFLYGYYEPTLFILCESTMTWVGRYAVKKDTCNSLALSLNLNQRTHPIIWPVDKLPSDCLRCYAVPPPIGGVLLFALNSLIYINQSVPSYGVSLNSLAKLTSAYPFKSMESTHITLDNSQAVFIAPDRMVVSLKGGELCLITMLTDSESLRSVRSFCVEKGPSSVIASCIAKCAESYVFVGSRLANSVLLKYTPKSTQKPTSIPNNIPNETSSTMEVENKELENVNGNGNEESKNQEEKPTNEEEEGPIKDERELDELDRLMNAKEETSETSDPDVVSYTFEICDHLLNIGPCGYSSIGESSGDQSEFDGLEPPFNKTFHSIDLVTSSGYAKNGSVSLLQRSLRPDLIATFQIPDVIDMWSLANDSEHSPYSPTYLFLSKSNSTVVLQIANEITELDKETSAFCTKSATIYCANIVDNKYLMQVTTSCVYLYNECLQSEEGPKLVYSLDLADKIDSRIKSALSVELYLVILSEKGTVYMFELFDDEGKPQFVEIDKVSESNVFFANVSCFTLYKDTTNLFSALTDQPVEPKQQKAEQSEHMDMDSRLTPLDATTSATTTNFFSMHDEMNVDDEEELLYGKAAESALSDSSSYINQLLTNSNNASTKTQTSVSATKTADAEQQSTVEKIEAPEIKKTSYWLLTVNFDGVLNLIWLNEHSFQLIYSIPRFNQAPKTIIPVNNYKYVPFESQESVTSIMRTSSIIETNQVQVSEILLVSIGFDKNRPILIVKMDEDLIIYEAFLTTSNRKESSSKQLNFRRMNHEIIIRDNKRKRRNQFRKTTSMVGENGNGTGNEMSILDPDYFSTRTAYSPTLRPFKNMANGMSGFSVTGAYPYLVFFCARSGLTPHPLWLDGPITSFCTLKNSSITLSGFIYINKSSNVRICTLPVEDANGRLQVHYDVPWMLKKVQIRQTVHFIAYHEESKTYAIVLSSCEPTNKLVQLGEEDKEVVTVEKDENFPLPNRSLFYIQLYTASTWEPLPLGKYELAEWEHVSTMKLVSLPYEGHSSGFRSYLAASTINCYTEDVNSRGRIILLDVTETVPDPDKPLTNIKLKTILAKEQKGPVTCLESVEGYLIGCVGQKVFIWEYANNELIGKAFIDAHFFIHKMVALKNFILIADIHRSIALIRFQKEYTKLSFVAKDKNIIDVYSCNYLVDNSSLAFIASDSEKNLNIYMYQSESHDNQGGQWLIRRAEFSVGTHINSMFRLKCKVNDPNLDKRSSLADKRQVTYCTTLDGGIGYVIPVSEKTFRRLFILQNAMYVMKQHYGGLNPKMFRIRKTRRVELCNPIKNTLDGDLLFEFLNMSYPDRNEISKKIKTNVEQLIDDLTEIFQFSCHF